MIAVLYYVLTVAALFGLLGFILFFPHLGG